VRRDAARRRVQPAHQRTRAVVQRRPAQQQRHQLRHHVGDRVPRHPPRRSARRLRRACVDHLGWIRTGRSLPWDRIPAARAVDGPRGPARPVLTRSVKRDGSTPHSTSRSRWRAYTATSWRADGRAQLAQQQHTLRDGKPKSATALAGGTGHHRRPHRVGVW
jgi:hypothetical protein